MSQSIENSPKQTFNGSCHCGFIKYTVKLASPGHATRCNCTICLKSGFTGTSIEEQDFTLLSPASYDELPDYQWRIKTAHRYFCNKCGIQVFGKGYYEQSDGKRVDFMSLNLLTLDHPQDGLDLRKWKIQYLDGKANNWAAGLKDEPWEHGIV